MSPRPLLTWSSDRTAYDLECIMPGPYEDRILLTVHGVTSDNSGLRNIRTYCEQQLPGLLADSYFYGGRIPFKDLTDDTAGHVFRSIRDKLRLVFHDHLKGRNRKLYIVAHSFGTLAVVQALAMHVPDLQLEGLILLGSIVPRWHDWDGLIEGNILMHPPLAIIRPFDAVVPGSPLVGGGPSGSRGFIATGMHLPLETYKPGGHVSYDPDDRDDIVTAIRDGVSNVQRTDYDAWYSSLSRWQRWRLRPLWMRWKF